ncbi:MAG: TPM domain-containing protein [Acidobacteriia bacterium]|nr:TPM domain-containing protein [Terriglobia bacterium]
MKKWLRLGVVAGFCASSGWAVDWKALRPQGYVSDFAGVIDAGAKSELENYCGQVERSTGVRISLVTISSLEGEPVADVGRTIFQAWGEGPNVALPNKDERVMLILTVADRRDWVATGAGLKPELTDGLAGSILRETRLALRKKDYGEAMRAAAETIGSAAARARKVTLAARISRRIRWSLSDSIPWAAVAGGLLILVWLMRAGNPAGYGGLGGRGLLPGLIGRGAMRRSTWGSRGSGGFGGFDSGDASGGFGGGACRDW